MNAQQSIVDVVNGVAIYADQRQWERLRDLYADQVDIDYTSFIGGEPAQVNADELIAGWRTGLGRYRATQHLLGNHRVTAKIGRQIAQELVKARLAVEVRIDGAEGYTAIEHIPV